MGGNEAKNNSEMREKGARLKFIREQKGLSQKDLAEKIYVAQQAISKIERGKGNLNERTAADIARVLHIDPGYLLLKTDFPTPADEIESVNSQNEREQYILWRLFSLLGELNGYSVKIQDNVQLDGKTRLDTYFEAKRNFFTLTKGSEEMVFDESACLNMGNYLSDVFESLVRMMWRETDGRRWKNGKHSEKNQ